VSSPSAEVLTAIALAAACGLVLLTGLVVTALTMRRISDRLTALHDALCPIGVITDPLPRHIAGISGNVGNLLSAATVLSELVRSRTEAADARH
jgi:hypothetical protein